MPHILCNSFPSQAEKKVILGDRRLNERAFALSQEFGKALSEIFSGATLLKRAYEFLPTQK
ncbi:hypothetical protein LC653_42145 [Nostoc sp. CHAB 5784]|uniref:IS4/Tn5 family transposase DNA-binding protein n=1 Tax=Nostoc mirabile TaxID=2907820 RepID=UPI001E4B4943|nr:hypothetical protein [Nostoc mirabile]MCC5670223.1 hypothetical protein [Nostoc mirabile CHAB5784]